MKWHTPFFECLSYPRGGESLPTAIYILHLPKKVDVYYDTPLLIHAGPNCFRSQRKGPTKDHRPCP